MGPDKGWFCVTFVYALSCLERVVCLAHTQAHRNYNCDYSGFQYTVTWPGFSSLPPGIDNALSSIICYPS